MKVIGFERNNFVVDGNEICGYNVYLTRPLSGDDSKGQAAERIYLTDTKLAANGLALNELMGKSVTVYYNRFGKVKMLTLDA